MIIPSSERQLQQICDNRIQISKRLNDVTTINPVPEVSTRVIDISTIKTVPETNNIVDNTPHYPNDDATSRDNFLTSSSPLSGKPGCALVLALGFYMNPVH